MKTCDSTGAIKRASKRATVVREKTASPCTPEWIGVWSRGCGRFGGGLEDHETAVRRAKTAFVCDCFANHLSGRFAKYIRKHICLHTRRHTHTHTHATLFVHTYVFLMCVCFVCYTSTHTHAHLDTLTHQHTYTTRTHTHSHTLITSLAHTQRHAYTQMHMRRTIQ